MARFDGQWIMLDADETASFHNAILHPDADVQCRRDAFFEELDRMSISENEDGSVDIEFTPKKKSNTATCSIDTVHATIEQPVERYFVDAVAVRVSMVIHTETPDKLLMDSVLMAA